MRNLRPVGASALLLVLACGLGWAQFNSNLQGIVQDSSGGVVPGASVKLRNVATNVVDEAKTNTDGYYRFTLLSGR